MADSKFHDQPGESEEATASAQPDTAAEPEAPEQMVVRRAPKITMFLVSGAVLGVVAAFFWVGLVGGTEEYSQGQALAFFAFIFGTVGLTIGALWWMIVDRRSKRQTETVYARRTQNPDAADVALTKDDYAQWSQFQQNERIEQARREQFAQAKAQAKAQKHSKRK